MPKVDKTKLRRLVRVYIDTGLEIKTLEDKRRAQLADIAKLAAVSADDPECALVGLAKVRYVVTRGRTYIDRARLLERGVEVEDVDYATVEGEGSERVQVYPEK